MPTPAAAAALDVHANARLTRGASLWRTATIESAGVPALTLADGPHGLRAQPDDTAPTDGLAGTPATCFPPAVALAASWNPALAERVGETIAREARAAGVHVVLGPGVNIKRSIRCGRNFEYFSEDPMLTGALGAAWVRGLQRHGVGASIKHFAANNQETDRFQVSAEVSERALREIYLRAFHHIVSTEQPWTVMCSYNRINGRKAAEHHWLLTEVLRDEWGFRGAVISDWGAVTDPVASVAAGVDLAMPGPAPEAADAVVDAVVDGTLSERVLTRAGKRIAELAERVDRSGGVTHAPDYAAHHELARAAAAASIVLLQNHRDVLPLDPGSGSIAVIGAFAETPRLQGAGSSGVTPTAVDTALTELIEQATGAQVRYAAGYSPETSSHPAVSSAAAEAADEAVRLAAASDSVLLFLGLPESAESEGFDRSDIELPAAQTHLLERIAGANPRTVVVLSHGSVVRMAGWAGLVPCILDASLLGQGGGWAIAQVVYGAVNPSGKLAETVPLRLEDTPDYLDFPGSDHRVRYGEDIFVGYRYYDQRALDVSFPFGHGLSYTSFAYSDLAVVVAGALLTVSVTVENTGARDGAETVQVYTGLANSRVARARRELRGFTTVELGAGASTRASITIPTEELAIWHEPAGRFIVEGGRYSVDVGASSRDIRAHAEVVVPGTRAEVPLSLDSTVDEWFSHPVAGPLVRAGFAAYGYPADSPVLAVALHMPLRGVLATPGVTAAALIPQLEQLAVLANSS